MVLDVQLTEPGVQVRARHPPVLHDWLVGQGVGVQERPSAAQVSTTVDDGQRVVPGVHVATQLPAAGQATFVCTKRACGVFSTLP